MTARLALAVLTFTLFATACQPGTRSSKDGAVLFDTVCAQCHARDGSGDPSWKARLNVPDLRSDELQVRLSDADIINVISNGSKNGRMPPWRGAFNDEQIKQLMIHVRSLRK
jgi:mono/diheme cytochrome c family protein